MEKVSLKKVAAIMKNLDFCMMVTKDGRNTLHSRPISNNGEVEYDGDSWFFFVPGFQQSQTDRKQSDDFTDLPDG